MSNKKDRKRLIGRLGQLYEQARRIGASAYLQSHASPASVERQVHVFLRYRKWLPRTGGAMLDWGCQHAPDSCMLQEAVRADLRSEGTDADGSLWTCHGCDFGPAEDHEDWQVFHRFAQLDYRPVRHAQRIPFEDGQFDVVVGSGVLEHAAMDFESLKELYRVLKPQGVLVLTFLPNKWSLSELAARALHLPAHLRRYRPAQVRSMLLHSGFEPLETGYHQFLPAHRAQRLLGPLKRCNGALERFWPLRVLSSNLFAVSRKRIQM
jgi:SAM-dependent methyltransferase